MAKKTFNDIRLTCEHPHIISTTGEIRCKYTEPGTVLTGTFDDLPPCKQNRCPFITKGNKIQVITAPEPLPSRRINNTIPKSMFLAGSIEMGNAENWQTKFIDALEYQNKVNIVLNPRRNYWDPTWKQFKSNPQFHEQVSWEMTAMDCAEYIFMYLDPNTKSPVTLLELGLYANSKKLIVCCPPEFYRKGNVDIVCERFGISQTYDMDTTITWLKHNLFWNCINYKKG